MDWPNFDPKMRKKAKKVSWDMPPVVYVIKLFWTRYRFPEIEKKFVLNNEAIFKQNYSLKLLITFKMACSCCFGLGENLDFPDFLQKKFYNIDHWPSNIYLVNSNLFVAGRWNIHSKPLTSCYMQMNFLPRTTSPSPSSADDLWSNFLCQHLLMRRPTNNVTRLGNLLDFGQLFKVCGNN